MERAVAIRRRDAARVARVEDPGNERGTGGRGEDKRQRHHHGGYEFLHNQPFPRFSRAAGLRSPPVRNALKWSTGTRREAVRAVRKALVNPDAATAPARWRAIRRSLATAVGSCS